MNKRNESKSEINIKEKITQRFDDLIEQEERLFNNIPTGIQGRKWNFIHLSKMSITERNTFFISFNWDKLKGWGTAQSFRFKDDELWVYILEKNGGCRWIPARYCHCDSILQIKEINKVLERDNVKIEDLKVIERFIEKFNAKSNEEKAE